MKKNFLQFYDRHFKIILILAFIVLMFNAFHSEMLVDDAFISFRYAKNLVDGHGLVWNPGEYVEGYTNFLWVILIAAGMWLGFQLETIVYALTIPIHLASLILTYLLATWILKNRTYGLLILLLVGFNHSVAGFAGSGLETPLQMLLFLLTCFILYRAVNFGWSRKRTVFLALTLCAAILTRPDGAILAAAGLIGWYTTDRNRKPVDYILLAMPFILIILPWLAWKYQFYGSLVPNTFYTKVKGLSGFRYGFVYFSWFVSYYSLLPFLALVLWKWKVLFKRGYISGFMFILTVVWIGYVTSVGGDFMEFRFLTPIIPFLLITIFIIIDKTFQHARVKAALILFLFFGTISNFNKFAESFYFYKVEPIEALNNHLYAPDENWVEIGNKLKELFGETDVLLGICAAGVIPYYSELRAVDFMGLTDKYVPQIGDPFSSIPGHRVMAPLEYAVNREVNLVVQPISLMMTDHEFRSWKRKASWEETKHFMWKLDKPVNGRLINEVNLLRIPIADNYSLIMWYLTPHEEIEKAIRNHSIEKIRLVRM